MKKELIILVIKINVGGASRQEVDKMFSDFIVNYSLKNDEELNEHYIVREYYIPIHEGLTDIKVIYPVPEYVTSPEINRLVEEVALKIKEDPTNELKHHWEKLVRELKLKKLND